MSRIEPAPPIVDALKNNLEEVVIDAARLPSRVDAEPQGSLPLNSDILVGDVGRLPVRPPRSWTNSLSDCCGAPGGWSLCAYVSFCPPCAAGHIGRYSGRDWCISAVAYPLCGWWLAGDRAALAEKLRIDDPLEGPAACCSFCCGCACCLLIQQHNEVLIVERFGNDKVGTPKAAPGTGSSQLVQRSVALVGPSHLNRRVPRVDHPST